MGGLGHRFGMSPTCDSARLDLSCCFSTFTHVRVWFLLVAVMLNFAAFAATAARWRLLFGARPTPSLWRFVEALFVAQLLNSVLPARSGAVGRAHFISRGQGFGTSYALGTVFAEKLIEGILLIPIIVLLLPSSPILADMPKALGASLLGIVFVAFVLVAVRARRDTILSLFRAVFGRMPLVRRLDLVDILTSAANGMATLGQAGRNPKIWILSGAIWLITAVMYFSTMAALGVDVPFSAAWVLLFVLQIGARVPALPAGIGVFHYLAILVLSSFAVDPTLALSVGIVLHTLVFILPSILGALVLWKR